jgi:hypothetical protein
MLSTLARAIHNNVRNSDNQKLNLSAHPPEFHVRGALTKCRDCFAPNTERTGKTMSGCSSPHEVRRLTAGVDPLRSVVRSWAYRRVLKYSDHPTAGLAGRPSDNAVNRESAGTGNHQRPLLNGLKASHHELRRLVVH